MSAAEHRVLTAERVRLKLAIHRARVRGDDCALSVLRARLASLAGL